MSEASRHPTSCSTEPLPLHKFLDNVCERCEPNTLAELKAFLDNGHLKDINKFDKRGQTPFHLACILGNKELASFLISNGASADEPNVQTNTSALHYACWLGLFPLVVRLADATPSSINSSNDDNLTPLHAAIIANDDVDIVNFLLDRGADIEASDDELDTCLHLSMAHRRVAVCKLLYSRGADIRALNSLGKSPLSRIYGKTATTLFDYINYLNVRGLLLLQFNSDRCYGEVNLEREREKVFGDEEKALVRVVAEYLMISR